MQPEVERRWKKARKHLLESAKVKQQVVEKCLESIIAATDLIADTFQSGGKLLLCGNGGSAGVVISS